jgi:hypothetical protein
MDGFTALAFGMCAQMALAQGQDLIELGEVIAGTCETHVYLGDSHGQTAHIHGHDIGVTIFGAGAEVWIDGRKFIVPKTAGA